MKSYVIKTKNDSYISMDDESEEVFEAKELKHATIINSEEEGEYLSKNLKEYLGLEDDCEVVLVTIMETGQIVDILDKIDQQLLTEHSFLKGYIRGLKDRLVPEEQPVFERGGQIFVKKLPEIVPKKSKNNQK